MSLGSTSPVEGSGPAVQHHRGGTALCEAAAAWGFSPGLAAADAGDLPLSVTAGQVHATHQHWNPGACALCVLSVRSRLRPVRWSLTGGVTLIQKSHA